jgi:ABC-type transport system involved in cytochrome c biogenesis permease subunit
MDIKFTIQHLLIYQTMMMYLLAFAIYKLRHRKSAWFVYTLGFAVSLISGVYRGFSVGHFPLQNLFEVFLFLGMMVFPLSVLCKKLLKIDGEAVDMLLGIVVLFPAGFVFNSVAQNLSPSLRSPLFVPHVAVYMLAYIIMTKACCQAAAGLITKANNDYELSAYKLVCLGFPLLTLGLILGSVWAKLAWGDYWSWDPKEMWALTTWLVYIAYFHQSYLTGVKYAKINSIWIFAGFAFIMVTLLWVNLSRIFAGLHNYAM